MHCFTLSFTQPLLFLFNHLPNHFCSHTICPFPHLTRPLLVISIFILDKSSYYLSSIYLLYPPYTSHLFTVNLLFRIAFLVRLFFLYFHLPFYINPYMHSQCTLVHNHSLKAIHISYHVFLSLQNKYLHCHNLSFYIPDHVLLYNQQKPTPPIFPFTQSLFVPINVYLSHTSTYSIPFSQVSFIAQTSQSFFCIQFHLFLSCTNLPYILPHHFHS